MRSASEGVRDPYQPALDRAVADLQQLDPFAAAGQSGADVRQAQDGAVLSLGYWGRRLEVSWATGQVRATDGGCVSTAVKLIALHYLITADGAPLADRWLAFRELSDGRVYDAAFAKRACLPLARSFGKDPGALAAAAQNRGGERLAYGDVAFVFNILPRVRVAVILNGRDDEFPADARVLFDAAVRHYLPIEDVAVLGELVAGALVRAAAEAGQQ